MTFDEQMKKNGARLAKMGKLPSLSSIIAKKRRAGIYTIWFVLFICAFLLTRILMEVTYVRMLFQLSYQILTMRRSGGRIGPPESYEI